MNEAAETLDRFWSKVNKDGPLPDQSIYPGLDRCWLWTAGTVNGYGEFAYSRRNDRAHRFAWKITNGEIPGGLCVLHKCDVRLCVNPNHLFLGTREDNITDKVSKNRQARGEILASGRRGELSGKAKLTMAQVIEIRGLRTAGVLLRDIARQFNIGISTVRGIANRTRWQSVP